MNNEFKTLLNLLKIAIEDKYWKQVEYVYNELSKLRGQVNE